jgi:hypothetical protein
MIVIRNYWLKKKGARRYRVVSYEINICPVCGEALIVIGTRERRYTRDDGEKETLVIRRMRCKGCRAIHHELPDMLIPYKRHCANTIEEIISGDIVHACCEKRTIDRIKAWWEGCRLYFDGVLTSLSEKYGIVFSANPAPGEIVRAVVNANLWVHTRSALLSG